MNIDYADVPVEENSIIYCDIPYAGTSGYSAIFNHERFWSWVRQMSQKGYRVYVSEYNAPFDFIPVWQKSICQLYSSAGNKKGGVVEKLFVHESQTEELPTDLFGNITI